MAKIVFDTKEEYDEFAEKVYQQKLEGFFEALYRVHSEEAPFLEYIKIHTPYVTEKEAKAMFKYLDLLNRKTR